MSSISAAAVKVMNSDKPSHLLQYLNFEADSKKDFLKSKL